MSSNAAIRPHHVHLPTRGASPMVPPIAPISCTNELTDPTLEPFLILARVRYSGLYVPDDDEPEISEEEIARIIAKHRRDRPMKASI